MTYEEYRSGALETATYPKELAKLYLDLGIHGEAGEVCDKFKKLIRDKGWEPGKDIARQDRIDILLELGDVMWYAANISAVYDQPMNFMRVSSGKLVNQDHLQIARYNVGLTVTELLKRVRTLHSEIDRGIHNLMSVVCSIGVIAECLGSSLEEVCRMNLEKLRDRKKRDKINGNGDHR